MAVTPTLLLFLLLPFLNLAAAETVLGAYIFHRHGDRTAKTWSPVILTQLGADQVFSSGSWYRELYVSANASSQIHGISANSAVLSQLAVTAPIDQVLQNSASVFLSGLYPPAGSASAQTLANGTSVEAPLGGYQYIPVNAVTNGASSSGSESTSWLQGGSGCGKAVVSSNNYFSSADYLATLNSTIGFYQNLLPVINGTVGQSNANFKNAYTIFDYVHVSTIHNASASIPSSSLLTNDTLSQLFARANQHEWGLAYNSSEPVRAIAGSVLAGQVLQALNTTMYTNASKASATRLTIQFGAYASFLSFFGLANLPQASTDFMGIVDYASSMAFELVTNATVGNGTVDPTQVAVRFRFANGTASADNPAKAWPLFGRDNADAMPWNDFLNSMQAFAITNTTSWCTACGNSTGVCAPDALSGGNSSGSGSSISNSSASGSGGVSTPVAGVIGALVTLVVILGIEVLVMLLAGLRVVKRGAVGRKAST